MKEKWQVKKLAELCEFDKISHKAGAMPYVGMEDIVGGSGEFAGSKEPTTVKSTTFRFTTEHLLYGRLRP